MRQLFVSIVMLAALAAGAWTTAGQGDIRLAGIADVEFAAFVTGPDSPSQTDVNYDVYGTDLGSMFEMNGLDEYQRAIVIREAPELTGPWSDSTVLVSGDDYPSLYGAHLHPWASDGETIYFNMSQWGPYNVLLMRARLIRAD